MSGRTETEPVLPDDLPAAPWPVVALNLLTAREQSFYGTLSRLYPDHKVFIQVALSQLIDMPRDHPDRRSIRNRFSQLVADFVLSRTDLTIAAVIELDDRSHERPINRADGYDGSQACFQDAGPRHAQVGPGHSTRSASWPPPDTIE